MCSDKRYLETNHIVEEEFSLEILPESFNLTI